MEIDMTIRSLLTIAALAGATIVGASSAGAAPVGVLNSVGDASSPIIKVHGCHLSCEWGPVLRWHRHVGPGCRPIACWPRASYPNRCWVGRYGVRHCRW
jgi:hypothetical protein